MKSSIFLAASGAVLAMAGPIDLKERAVQIVTDVVVDTVVDVVTVQPTTTPLAIKTFFAPGEKIMPHIETDVTTVTPVAIAPVPATTESPSEVIVTVTQGAETTEAAPAPTTEAVAVTTPAKVEIAASTQAAAATSTPTDLPSMALYSHNVHRANNSAAEVTYDDDIAAYAATLAATCVFAHNTTADKTIGQNIAMWGSSSNAQSLGEAGAIGMAADMWYNGEINLYDSSFYTAGPDMSNFEGWGHYTQLVWAATKQIGCASQFCPAGTMYSDMDAWFMVCNYFPAGNIATEYVENVLAPLGKPTVST